MAKTLIEEVQPWQRQESEGAKAYAAFSIYRDMGPERSRSKVCAVTEKKNGANWTLGQTTPLEYESHGL